MAFVNERVSEEDIQKYGLDELMREFFPFDREWKNGRPSGFWYSWTIDRNRGIYFLITKTITETGDSGRPEPTNKRIAILNFQGKRISLIIKRTYCSPSFSDNPFLVAWSLLEINTLEVHEIDRTNIIDILKEALSVYGYRGAYSNRATNVVVKFNF
ncbi:hypothetical protein [Stenoxybacter acetivorans]|uniref:hypothetical protein n=1 Tax=Stenoxybacter acetivorans TaxID=422441 RepID=UPI00055AEDA9|nr:hypothetical protein [Stenoxybacter acetivorans]